MPLIKRLQESPPFNQLPESVVDSLRQAAQLKTFAENVDIFKQNDPPTGYLYVIKEGMVAITVMSPGGVDMVVDYRKEGQFFGGTPIFTGEPYSGGARTVTATECYLIPNGILQELQQDYPQISSYFTHLVLSRVRNLYSEIVSEHSGTTLSQMEAYPFKKHLSEIMSSPAATCAIDCNVREIARRLTESQVNCLIVVDTANIPIGAVTGRDLVAKALAPENVDLQTLTAKDLMQPQVHSMAPETYMYEAMAYMTRHRLNHLLIVDREQPVGIVTPRDLMRYRCQNALLLLGNIRDEQTLDGLAAIHREIATVARTLITETRSTPEVMEILSYIHHAIIRRTYEICLKQMRTEGWEPPDVKHCFLIMGSGGRREMVLNPDQDNGFIFEDVPDERLSEIEGFFQPFSEKLNVALAHVGYPLCKGGVMARNPDWRGRLKDWQERVNDWLLDPDPTHVRESSIFFDFYPLTGDIELANYLRDIVAEAVKTHHGFLYHMMSLDLRYKVPLGLLNRFIVEKEGPHEGRLSVKYGGSVYIVDCVRMFALEHNIRELSTFDRLEALVEKNVFAAETAEHIRAAFEALVFLRMRHEISLIEQNQPPTHFIDPFALSKSEQDLLKEAFQAVAKLQDATKRHFSRAPF